MKKVVAYCRVSTKGQIGEDKFGLDEQQDLINQYCSDNNMEIVDWFVDEAVSGEKEHRPELDRLLAGEITNPPVEAVIVAKADRLARDITLYHVFKHLLKKLDLEIISVKEDWSAQDRLTAMILENFNAMLSVVERENIRIRTMGGRKQKAKMGGYAGGRIPMGYALENGKLIINEPEAKVVRYIFSLRRNGATFYEIIDALKRAGHKSRNGKDFAISTVQSILNNEKTYRGFYKYGKNADWVQGVHEPILTKEDDGENQS